MTEESKEEITLEGGTYEILRKRLSDHAEELQKRLSALNADRKSVFGSIEPKLLANERITTENNCIPRDIVSLGETFIFAYNVQFGLKAKTELSDVFAIYHLDGHAFTEQNLSLLDDPEFQSDFDNLYKYYKNTIFARFFQSGPYLYMVFRIGKSVTDIKTFKWLITPDKKLKYQDNRSDHEYTHPTQHEFTWTRATRDDFVDGRHPHISIRDKVFVECVGGDLTIKIENNTESGEGILAEPVDDPEQKLDDADVQYAFVGPLILLRIKPYREEKTRYFIYNEKIHEAMRFDEIKDSCVLLPDNLGLIFPNGYYLVSGEFKRFDYPAKDMLFEKRIPSPNGEDTLYAFFNREVGLYILLSYNLIDQSVQTPIQCHGYSFFHQGEMIYFRGEDSPQKHHAVQIWQTPYVSPDYTPPVTTDSFLFKIGNKELVRCMAECQNIYNLSTRENPYQSLYDDIHRMAVAILDSYFWIQKSETQSLGATLESIRDTASAAIDEFDKVRRIQKNTELKVTETQRAVKKLLGSIKPDLMKATDEFVGSLSKLRTMRGEIIALRELRYVDTQVVDQLEEEVVERSKVLAENCVEFLLKPDALEPYHQKVAQVSDDVAKFERAIDAKELEDRISTISKEVETMIEVVGNLKIADATKSTQIIDGCSEIFTALNTVRAELKNRKKSMQSAEAIAEFSAQMKLLDQSVVSYLDVADSPEKCDEYQNKLLVQLEELEGRFADFDDYVVELSEKRHELIDALESRKLTLLEEKNKKASSLHSAAERILKAIAGRAESIKEIAEINSFFAGDLMIDKVRGIIEKLIDLDDSVKADEIQSNLKSTQENAIRQLKDRKELFQDGKNVIKFGRHAFSVNVQKTDLSILSRNDKMFFHITGTNFFEEVKDEAFNATRSVWSQDVISENRSVYRGEFLANQIIQHAGTEAIPELEQLFLLNDEQLTEVVQKYMAPRYDEGYTKGVHDKDGVIILSSLLKLIQEAGLLRYHADARSVARLFWYRHLPEADREKLEVLFQGVGNLRKAYKGTKEFQLAQQSLTGHLRGFINALPLFEEELAESAAEYLFDELSLREGFITSPEAARIHDEFIRHLREHHLLEEFEHSIKQLENDLAGSVQLLRGWLSGFLRESKEDFDARFLNEAVSLFATGTHHRDLVHRISVVKELENLKGSHSRIQEGKMTLDLPEFMARLDAYQRHTIPLYQQFLTTKKSLIEQYKEDLRLNEFKPRVLTSFVRNKLIDEVYLPMIGDNLAKQIGTTGADKRTDLMGMLLLISPPGYGKTTLMEYIASRLGVIFVKINGPAIGHQVTNVDPQEAPNAAAREEIEKLNLAFEMGDNIMIYLDDIQHCNPEFLQKFISLCDGQRRIEGIWKGRSKTYDFRGKKVAVVMAGNPYTESGDKFQIPDMLANRADTYNLGDILGDYRDAFEVSYIENCLTSNSILSPLATKSKQDIYQLIKLARTNQREGIELEGNYSPSEINDFVSVLEKLLRLQDTILKVNKEYIRSASQADEYRTEPAFKLQGSYRNMNKLAEKVLPIMNDDELTNLIVAHYEGESQTLTNGAEANLLKFRELTGLMSPEHEARWKEIKESFQRKQKFHGMDAADSMTKAIVQLGDLTTGVEKITQTLSPLGGIADGMKETSASWLDRIEQMLAKKGTEPSEQQKMPEKLTAEISAESLAPIIEAMKLLKEQQNGSAKKPDSAPGKIELSQETVKQLTDAISSISIKTELPNVGDAMDQLDSAEEKMRGEFLSSGSLRTCLEQNGFNVDEFEKRRFRIQRDKQQPIELSVRNDRLILRMDVPTTNQWAQPDFIERVLSMNTEIQPVCFAIERDGNGQRQLVLMESRDGKNLTRGELNEVIRAMEDAAVRANGLIGRTL